jgi:pyruvate formate lyase activating enzyme
MVKCDFCYRHCAIEEGKRGFCGVRENRNGTIVSVHYGELVSLALDPIEKKPLYHFLPGSTSVSLAEQGCNYRCAFCQNYEISQPGYEIQTEHIDPEQVIQAAKRTGAESISFTYSEPLVWQDYMMEVAKRAKEEHIATVMVSNGSFSDEALERLLPLIDAYNIDVKGDERFYEDICKASLRPVLDGIERITREGKHLEVTTLLIEGLHNKEMIQQIGKELKERQVEVWHLSRFFPRYHMEDRKETSEAFLSQILTEAKASGIPYIYGGNSIHEDATICPGCGKCLISSHAYNGNQAEESMKRIVDGRCIFCGAKIYGKFGDMSEPKISQVENKE